MLDGPRDSSNDYRPENSPPSNTFNFDIKTLVAGFGGRFWGFGWRVLVVGFGGTFSWKVLVAGFGGMFGGKFRWWALVAGFSGNMELTQPRRGGGGGSGRAVPRCRHIGCVVSHGAAAMSCCVRVIGTCVTCAGCAGCATMTRRGGGGGGGGGIGKCAAARAVTWVSSCA